MARRWKNPTTRRRLAKTAKPMACLPQHGFEPTEPTGKNPTARRVKRMARKGHLVGWPFERKI
ncbi:hypothetical protein [Paracoccus siganidrum]|uniref:hypothetical protein n=1 Tax=Paracoccus siganidrum TaxID=1276757 RepID=UPI0011C3643D|nr:hypothetical protein [Paracoccus siganidrum]